MGHWVLYHSYRDCPDNRCLQQPRPCRVSYFPSSGPSWPSSWPYWSAKFNNLSVRGVWGLGLRVDKVSQRVWDRIMSSSDHSLQHSLVVVLWLSLPGRLVRGVLHGASTFSSTMGRWTSGDSESSTQAQAPVAASSTPKSAEGETSCSFSSADARGGGAPG